MGSGIAAVMQPGCDLDGGQCRREVVGAGFDGLWNRHPQFALAIRDAPSTSTRSGSAVASHVGKVGPTRDDPAGTCPAKRCAHDDSRPGAMHHLNH